MKNSSLRLIRFFRCFFAVLRILTSVILCFSPFTLLPTITSGASADLLFAALPQAIQPSVQLAKARGKIAVKHLTADVKLESEAEYPGMRSLELKVTFPSRVILGLLVFLVFDTLWRLFRNADEGVIFDPHNVALIQRLGILIIGGSVIWEATSFWSAYQLSSFLSENGILQGLTLGTPINYVDRSVSHVIASLVEGGFVFILAEVFRHGLKLQQETDLTV